MLSGRGSAAELAVNHRGSNGNGYAPAPAVDVADVLDACLLAVSLIPYLDFVSGEATGDHREMVVVRTRSTDPRLDMETVRMDLAIAWKAHVVGADTSLHVVSDRRSGIDFRFAILRPNRTFLTGVIAVDSGLEESPRLLRRAAKQP